MFEETFLDGLSEDPIIAANQLCDEFLEFRREEKANLDKKLEGKKSLSYALASMAPNLELHEKYLEAFAIFLAFAETNRLQFDIPQLTSDKKDNMQRIDYFFDSAKQSLTKSVTELTLARIKTKYTTRFGKAFLYEFSQGDLERIQNLINELREKINVCETLEENHKSRLLRRLERLQSELHKKVSDLDRFWGLVGDAGVVLGKLGKDAKPIVDRIREITQIIWRTQSRAEELPTDAPIPQLSRDKTE